MDGFSEDCDPNDVQYLAHAHLACLFFVLLCFALFL